VSGATRAPEQPPRVHHHRPHLTHSGRTGEPDSARTLVFRASAVTAVGGLLFGYDTGVISGALPFVADDFGLSSFMKSTVTSILLLGAALGAFLAGRLADVVGRKPTVVATAVVAAAGILVSILAPEVWTLVVGRVILGMGVGSASVVVPLYIGEVAPPAVRGRLVSLNQLAITVGILVAGLVDYFLADTANWRLMVGFALIPAVLLGVGVLTQPESPSWLIRHHREDEAREILRRFRDRPEDVEAEVDEVHEVARTEGTFPDIFARAVRPALVIGILLAVIQQVTGINTVIYYAPTLLQGAGLGTHAAIFATVLVGLVNVLLTVAAILLLDRVGRRPLLLCGSAGMVVGLVVLGTVFLGGTDLHGPEVGIAIAALMFYVGAFAISLGPGVWLILSEIYPLRVRGQAMGVATIFNWVANFAVAISYLHLLDVSEPGTFYGFALLTVMSGIFIWAKVPETKGRPLAEIERDLGTTDADGGAGRVRAPAVDGPSSR
jgi:sugar porter (SP) family MFS transporter